MGSFSVPSNPGTPPQPGVGPGLLLATHIDSVHGRKCWKTLLSPYLFGAPLRKPGSGAGSAAARRRPVLGPEVTESGSCVALACN